MAHADAVNKFDSFQNLRRNSEHGFRVELVVTLMDKVLSDYHESHDKLYPETVLRVSTQILKAVKFIQCK
jgi:serine/threonine-protein kinase SRPK3